MAHFLQVFVSTTSRDLGSFRQAVDVTLRKKRVFPIIQEVFIPDYRSLMEVLREQISQCDAVIHVAGFLYGAEPGNLPPETPRRSYTQLEFHLAAEMDKPIYVFMAREDCQFDQHAPEHADLQALQEAYRILLESRDNKREYFSSRLELEKLISEIDFGPLVKQKEVAGAPDALGNLPGCDEGVISRFLRGDRSAGGAPILAEIAKYAEWAESRYGTIELRGVRKEGQQVVQMDLGRVYVPLEATAYIPGEGRSAREGPQTRPIRLDEMLGVGRRIILTGGPGSGKTTVLLHVIRTLADAIQRSDQAIVAEELGLEGELPLPIFVPMSAFAAHLRRGTAAVDGTLAEFIAAYFRQHYSTFNLGADFFRLLLHKGREVILLLDGLDEVPNETERVRIRQAVEELVVGRPEMRVVVTCRTAAYNGRTALGQGFREVRVKPLEFEHVIQLVQHAYSYLHADPQTAKVKTIELLRAVQQIEAERVHRLGYGVQRLIDSPLLVRLLMIVHFNNQHVPAKRAELYAKATDAMLVPDYGPDEEVSEAIGRTVGGSKQPHRSLVQHVAFQMHGEGQEDGREIDEFRLRQMLASQPELTPLTEEFIALTRLRGTLMEERLGQYRFIHLAFQEFLTARYLIETVGMQKGVDGIVAFLQGGPVTDTWWREVILLLVGHLAEVSPKTAEQILLRLAGVRPGTKLPDRGDLPSDVWLSGVEMAAAALLEWAGAREEVRHQARGRLQESFAENGADLTLVAPPLRAAVGQALGHFGDIRPPVTSLDAMQFCFVPAGPVRLGGSQVVTPQDAQRRESLDLEKPVHEFSLSYDYWIGRYPVTNAQFAAFVQDGGYHDRQFWKEAESQKVWRTGQVLRWFWQGQQLRNDWETGPHDYGPPFTLPNHPAVGVCWFEDLAFMRWLTRRWRERGWLPPGYVLCFPNEPEWEKAARGGLHLPEKPIVRLASDLARPIGAVPLRVNEAPDRLFPWGNPAATDHLNAQETGVRSTNTPGCFPMSVSPYGCEELCGNTWEWTRSLWGEHEPGSGGENMVWKALYRYPYDPTDGREVLNRGGYWLRVARGGGFITETRYSRCSFRDNGSPNFRFPWDGFRIAILPEAVLEAAQRKS